MDAFTPKLLATDMTLRDWFAGQALTAMSVPYLTNAEATYRGYAAVAYQIADAMLEQRSQNR